MIRQYWAYFLLMLYKTYRAVRRTGCIIMLHEWKPYGEEVGRLMEDYEYCAFCYNSKHKDELWLGQKVKPRYFNRKAARMLTRPWRWKVKDR